MHSIPDQQPPPFPRERTPGRFAAVLLLSGYQDTGLRARMGAAFGFFMAIAFGISALVTAIRANLPYAAAICAVVLCSEILSILRWSLRRTSA